MKRLQRSHPSRGTTRIGVGPYALTIIPFSLLPLTEAGVIYASFPGIEETVELGGRLAAIATTICGLRKVDVVNLICDGNTNRYHIGCISSVLYQVIPDYAVQPVARSIRGRHEVYVWSLADDDGSVTDDDGSVTDFPANGAIQ